MKNLLTIIALLAVSLAAAQQQEQDSAKVFLPREYFKIYFCAPTGVGDNVLHKAHRGDWGMGLAFTFVQYRNFQLNGGVRYLQYKTEDPAFATTADNLKLSGIYGEIAYKIPVANKVTLNPQVLVSSLDMNIGGSAFSFKKSKGRQSGTTIGAGFDVDYALGSQFKVYTGVTYSMSYLNTNTAPELEKFYNRLGQLNIMLGFKI
jgi:hypothetical protein